MNAKPTCKGESKMSKSTIIFSIGLLGDLAAAINRNELKPDSLEKIKNSLLSSTRFFDAYIQSRVDETPEPYLVLLGSASYYLCDLPEDASALVRYIDDDSLGLDGDGLENLLLWLLRTDQKVFVECAGGIFNKYIDEAPRWLQRFFEDGTDENNLPALITKLRQAVYEFGTPRHLLLGDIIAAIVRKKLKNYGID